MIRRLFLCQGSVQMLTAAAAAAVEDRDRNGEAVENIIVVHGLFASEEKAFRAVIDVMAKALLRPRAIHHLGETELADWGRALKNRPRSWVLAAVRRRFSLSRVDEIYASRGWLLGNELLLHAYPDARRICYGDGIGFPFSRDYGSPAGTPSYFADPHRAVGEARGLTSFWRRIKAGMGIEREAPELGFHQGFFALPTLFERPDFPWTRLEPRDFHRLFRQLDAIEAPPFFSGRPAVVALTSNLSEALRIGGGHELDAYFEWLAAHSGRLRLLLKPHPRERLEKVQELARRLAPYFPEVGIAREGPFPLEWLLWREPSERELSRYVTFGTSCLSLAFLFGLRAELGFGEALVRRYFSATNGEWRLLYEKDLRSGLDELMSRDNDSTTRFTSFSSSVIADGSISARRCQLSATGQETSGAPTDA